MVIPISDGVTAALRLPPRHRVRSRSSRAQRVQGTARLRPAHRGQGRRRVRPVSTSPTPRPRAPADPGYLCESWSPPGDAPACTQYGRLASLGRFSCTLSLFMPIWKPFMAWMAVCALAGLSKLTKPGETRGTRAWVSKGPPRPGGGGGGEGPWGRGRGGAGRAAVSPRSRHASGRGRGSRLLPLGAPPPSRPSRPPPPPNCPRACGPSGGGCCRGSRLPDPRGPGPGRPGSTSALGGAAVPHALSPRRGARGAAGLGEAPAPHPRRPRHLSPCLRWERADTPAGGGVYWTLSSLTGGGLAAGGHGVPAWGERGVRGEGEEAPRSELRRRRFRPPPSRVPPGRGAGQRQGPRRPSSRSVPAEAAPSQAPGGHRHRGQSTPAHINQPPRSQGPSAPSFYLVKLHPGSRGSCPGLSTHPLM